MAEGVNEYKLDPSLPMHKVTMMCIMIWRPEHSRYSYRAQRQEERMTMSTLEKYGSSNLHQSHIGPNPRPAASRGPFRPACVLCVG